MPEGVLETVTASSPRLMVVLAACLVASPVAAAQDAARELVVGTKEAPPFAHRDPGGDWSGLSIDLWRKVAEDLNLSFRLEERDLKGLLDGVEDGSLDAAVAALTVTAKREERIDFTHPFHTSGLAIAVPSRDAGAWGGVVDAVFSERLLQAVGALLLVLFAAAAGVWVFERKENAEQFGGGHGRGLFNAFWWSAVTMTTVGYGDMAPRTVGGRVLALVWMFTSVVIVSSFTASIASSLTVNEFRLDISSPDDLRTVTVGTVDDSTSSEWAERQGLPARSFGSLDDGLRALIAGQLDSVVYDAPVLQHVIRERYQGKVSLVPGVFERQDYAVVLPTGSALREPVNLAILRVLASPDWREARLRHLGE